MFMRHTTNRIVVLLILFADRPLPAFVWTDGDGNDVGVVDEVKAVNTGWTFGILPLGLTQRTNDTNQYGTSGTVVLLFTAAITFITKQSPLFLTFRVLTTFHLTHKMSLLPLANRRLRTGAGILFFVVG